MGANISKPIPTDTIIFDDAQLIKWLQEKDALVKEGREVSKRLDAVEKEIQTYVDKEMKLTAKVEPKELIAEGNKLRDEINERVKLLEKVAEDIRKEKLKAIPKDMETEHLKLNDQKEKLEKERNKIALKVQKIKDRFVPKLQKIALKHLGEFEDLSTAELKDGKVVVEKFSHLQEWKRQWKARK